MSKKRGTKEISESLTIDITGGGSSKWKPAYVFGRPRCEECGKVLTEKDGLHAITKHPEKFTRWEKKHWLQAIREGRVK